MICLLKLAQPWLKKASSTYEFLTGIPGADYEDPIIEVDPVVVKRNWRLHWGGWLGLLFFDWLFGTALEWYPRQLLS